MLLLSHIGQELPPYINEFITQLRKFNSDYEIVFLCNTKVSQNSIFIENNIKTYPVENLINEKINIFINKFGYGNINTIHKNIEYGGVDYWCVTAVRLFFISEYAKNEKIKNFFHFENDILLYESLDKIKNVIVTNNLFENQIAITRGTKNKIMTGFMYVDNVDILEHVLDNMINMLDDIPSLYNYDIDHLNEMGLLHIYQTKYPEKMVNLPIVPNKDLNNNFSFFNSVFDPATYGQFLDGTPGTQGVSLLPESIIADEFSGKDLSITFEYVDNKKTPFVLYDNKKFKINSLHIHSKRLNLFTS